MLLSSEVGQLKEFPQKGKVFFPPHSGGVVSPWNQNRPAVDRERKYKGMARDYDICHTNFDLVKVTVPVPQQSKLPQFEGKWAMRMSPEMLIMFA